MTKGKSKQVKVQLQPAKKKKQRQQQNATKKEKEVTLLGGALRSLGGLGGAALGGLFGQSAAGSSVGTSLGATISRWLGSGDYQVSQNSLVQRVQSGSPAIPMMHKEGQSILVRHKEFIATINGSTNFSVQRFFIIQPGDSNTFPWLSTLAARFQQYRVRGMVFHYVPSSGNAISGSNPAVGTVMMQTSYRANDTEPSNKVEMLNEYWAGESSPTEAFCHPIECDPKENPFSVHYVRTNPVPTNDSPMMYDVGKMWVATQGMPASGNPVGDLWVSYEIELSKPQIQSSVADRESYGTSYAINPSVANWFGTATTGNATGSINFTTNTNTLTFPIGLLGTYLINVNISASTTFSAIDLGAIATLTNCSVYPLTAYGTTYYRTVVAGATATANRGFYMIGVTLSDPSATASVLFPAGTWTGTAVSTEVVVSRIL